MINEQFDNLIEDLKELKMSSEEKKSVYNQALYSIAKIEAVHDEALHSHAYASSKTSIKSVFVSVWESYIKEKKFIPALSIVGILILSGGASLFAEQALPGDSLYSLKVNVNENVRGLAAVTPEAKAKFALEVTGRRLQEAATLSTRGQLTAENSEIIRQQLIKQVGQVKNQVASLASTNNLKAAQGIAVNFESSLKAHELILEKISKDQQAAQSSSTTPTDASHIGSIIAAVKTELATTTQSRVDLQAKELSTDASPEKVKTRLAELKLQVVEVKLSAQTASLSTTTASTSAYLIAQADLLVALADKNIESGTYSTALAIIQKTSQLLSDIDAVIDADSTAGVDLKAIINEALSGNNINFDLGIDIKATDTNTDPKIPVDNASSTASSTVSSATTTPVV